MQGHDWVGRGELGGRNGGLAQRCPHSRPQMQGHDWVVRGGDDGGEGGKRRGKLGVVVPTFPAADKRPLTNFSLRGRGGKRLEQKI